MLAALRPAGRFSIQGHRAEVLAHDVAMACIGADAGTELAEVRGWLDEWVVLGRPSFTVGALEAKRAGLQREAQPGRTNGPGHRKPIPWRSSAVGGRVRAVQSAYGIVAMRGLGHGFVAGCGACSLFRGGLVCLAFSALDAPVAQLDRAPLS